MLGDGTLALDLSPLLQFACTALALLVAALLLVKKTASRYFFVDAGFEEAAEGYHARHGMPICGGGGGEVCYAGGVGPRECASCASSATKKCSRCKSVWYCSPQCQSKHWETEHKTKCRQVRALDKFDNYGTGERRKSSAVSLVPENGACKQLKEPKKILFPYDEFAKLFNWDKPGTPPCGLLNCGNSCFANVVLQCLACTQPLVAYLLEKDHNRACLRRRDDWCFLCELQVHIRRASQSSQPFSPISILSRLPNIGGNLGYGRQEDAHEFMRFAIDTMQSICLDEYGGEKAVDPSTQETTIIQHIFGGHLQSQVICTKCGSVSNRYENMMDLTVEIQGGAESLKECLDQFTVKEWLDGDNMYKCDGCNDYVKAWKRLTVHQAPNVLTITLKRFQSGRFGKLNKRVTFPEHLDLTAYMSGHGDGSDQYTLYAVVVHVDMLNASFFGHYICYVKDYQGLWYKIDDCKVLNVEVEEVLAQGAYMLLYHRITPRKEPFVRPLEPTMKKHLAVTSTLSTQEDPVPSARFFPSIPFDNEANADVSRPEMHSDIEMSKDTGHDRLLKDTFDSSNNIKTEDMELDSAIMVTANPDPMDYRDLGMDHSYPSSAAANRVVHENFSLSEDSASVKPLVSKSSTPLDIYSFNGEATKHQESHSNSCSNFQIDENGSADMNSESTITDRGQNIAEASAGGLSTSCKDQQSTPPLRPQSNGGFFHSVSSLECKRPKEVLENSSKAKTKPLFTRGFLDKPAKKKPAECEETIQMENHMAPLSLKANGFFNGYLKHVSEVKPSHYNSLDAISNNGNGVSLASSTISMPPGVLASNRQTLNNHAETECDGILSSFLENGVKEFGGTSVEINNSASDSNNLVLKMDEAKSKMSELHHKDRQSFKALNGLPNMD